MARHLLTVHWPARHPWRGENGPVDADRKDLMRKTTGTKRVARVPRNSGLWGILAVPMLPELVVDPRIAWVLDSHTARIPKFKTLAAQSAACFRCLAAEGNHPPHRRLGHQRLSWGASFQR
jgi:hypothetical protein